ncbi:hypothetical protein [Fictibacillus barbaricus]|uniref:O-antigen ligase n=1 Tax=Fictibacillus barbaricus TaxID=182136 RepID=A0ABU1U137_9BACL|nr:hypothetical protein [Fictibacillus barbaricus]MDR7073193.1 O-antigen ligase [Fictibacillus barbaricus]
MRLISHNKSLKLAMLFPIIFILMPKFEGSQFITYPILGLILLGAGYTLLKDEKLTLGITDRNFTIVASLLLIYVFCMGISYFVNINDLSLKAIPHFFKPILFLMVLSYGYLVALRINSDTIKKALLKSAYIIVIAQIIVGITQLLDLPIFRFIYDDSKSYPIWKLVRTTGTLANPNIFGWVITQMTVIIYLFEMNKRKKWAWLFIGLILMVLSGSRSVLVMFPLVFIFIELVRSKKDKKFFIIKVPLFISGLGLAMVTAYWLILKFGHVFPYLRQLVLIVRSGSLSSVSSFSFRTKMWDNALILLNEKNAWLFGLGPGSLRVLDKDLLYSLTNYGIIGTLVMIIMYLVIAYYFLRLKDKRFSLLGLQYIAFSFIIGYQVETLSGWNYPMLIMFYTGIALVLYKKQRESEKVD